MSPSGSLVLDSITHMTAEARGRVVVAGSHCAPFAAALALGQPMPGVIMNDAGVGRDEAGITGLADLEQAGMPAAVVAHTSARIGDGADCLARGVVSHLNDAARRACIDVGQSAREVAEVMAGLPVVEAAPPEVSPEQRTVSHPSGARRPLVVVDSASLVVPEDAGAVVVTGSHGGLLGGRAEWAIKAPVFAAAYNDAGGGIDGAGMTRLPVLQARGIAGVVVDAFTARIGDGASTLDDGVISHANDVAAALGAKPGMPLRAFVALAVAVDATP